MRPYHLFIAALVANPACVMLETEIPHVCVQQTELEVPVPLDELGPAAQEALGVTDDPPPQTASSPARAWGLTAEQMAVIPVIAIEKSFKPDGLDAIPNALDELGASGDLSLLSVWIAGADDVFAGVQRVALVLSPGPESTAFEPVTLAVCDQSDGCDTTTAQMDLVTASQQDLLPLLQHETVELRVELVARPTVPAYILDVDVCMAASARVELSP